jgi:hypothetical protein
MRIEMVGRPSFRIMSNDGWWRGTLEEIEWEKTWCFNMNYYQWRASALGGNLLYQNMSTAFFNGTSTEAFEWAKNLLLREMSWGN